VANRSWIVGNGIVVPQPDDPRWTLKHEDYFRSWISLGSVQVHERHASLYIANSEVRGFRAWRYARAVHKAWGRRQDEEILAKQRREAMNAIGVD
jgi:hypothetical protein